MADERTHQSRGHKDSDPKQNNFEWAAWKTTTLHKPANPNKKNPQQAESIIDVFINRACTQVREESSASVRYRAIWTEVTDW
jgi:hypothetical protein